MLSPAKCHTDCQALHRNVTELSTLEPAFASINDLIMPSAHPHIEWSLYCPSVCHMVLFFNNESLGVPKLFGYPDELDRQPSANRSRNIDWRGTGGLVHSVLCGVWVLPECATVMSTSPLARAMIDLYESGNWTHVILCLVFCSGSSTQLCTPYTFAPFETCFGSSLI